MPVQHISTVSHLLSAMMVSVTFDREKNPTLKHSRRGLLPGHWNEPSRVDLEIEIAGKAPCVKVLIRGN